MPINVCLKFMALSPCIDQDYEDWFLLVKISFHYFEDADARVALHELSGFFKFERGIRTPGRL
jgi:hypothetical protein